MLAQNFMTPQALGISDIEFESLVKVLGMLERQEIPFAKLTRPEVDHTKEGRLTHFNMVAVVTPTECGTAGCICGWARFLSRDWSLFGESLHRHAPGLGDLFFMGRVSSETERAFGHSCGEDITPAQAAIALRNYLTTGQPNWAEALAE